MVTTRGKKIKFEVDSSEGEQDGDVDVERPVKPAAKRRRTKKSKSADDDTAFNPSSSSSAKGKEKETPEQNLLITRRGGRGGKLRDLMNMPIDIFSEVCSYLDPFDLRRLALTSKRLWDILMTKEARHIWKTALDSVPDLPECPTDLNEPQYVCLLYSSECYTIGCASRGTKADWFHRVRFCASCFDAKMMNDSSVRYDRDFVEEFKDDTLYAVRGYFDSDSVMGTARHYRRSYRRGYRRKNDERHYYTSALKAAAHEYESLPQEESSAYLAQLQEQRDYRVKTGTAMLKWKFNQLASRADDIVAEKNARFESIKVKLFELGWEEKDFPTSTKEFRDLVLKDQKLTPKVWQNIRPKLEPLLQNHRTERLEIEKRQRRNNREDVMRKYYYQIGHDTMDMRFSSTQLSYFLPDFDEVIALPSVKPLFENDTETVTEEQWIEVAPDVRLIVLKWWRKLLKQYVDAFENGTELSWDATENGKVEVTSEEIETEDALSASIEALKAQLSYATSVFRCKASYCKSVWWFPHSLKHTVSQHYPCSMRELLSQSRPLKPEGLALVKRLLQDLNLDPETVQSSAIHDEDQSQKYYLCTRCDERIAKHMTFGELIDHYLEVQKWYDETTAAIKTSPDSCYPSRAVSSVLPKIINDHDWTSGDAVLVRKDDEATKQAVLDLQTAFRKEALTDPACDTKGIGGEDFEKNPWREVTMTCKLCPREFAPNPAGSRKIEIHIRSKHGKEPDLETDTTLERVWSSVPCPL